MFEQVTLQHFFLGVNHLKKSRRYFEKKKISKIRKKSWKKLESHGLLNQNSAKYVKKIAEKKAELSKAFKKNKNSVSKFGTKFCNF